MLAFENRMPDVTLAKLNNRECQNREGIYGMAGVNSKRGILTLSLKT